MSDPSSTTLPPLPSDHLDHPEQWTTGSEPATEKQKGFIAVLEKQNPGLVPDEGIAKGDLGKSEASEIIESLKKGEKVGSGEKEAEVEEDNQKKENEGDTSKKEEREEEEGKTGEKRKDHPSSQEDTKEGKKGTTVTSTQKSEKDELVSSQDIDVDVDDEKDPKQTTLDGVFGGESEEKEEGDRASKKPKLDDSSSSSTNGKANAAKTSDPSISTTTDNNPYDEAHPPVQADSGATYPKPTETDTIPGSPTHLDHPENWATGDQPATDKQKGFIKVLEKQKGVSGSEDVEGLGKSEASEKIEELKEM
ncbi:hypothetical protein I204_06687 [Kwoniella mangroviensis CBS 8886]|uniref:uncharacterized protein n=1 Tax=Kwoniella mangroviensis CBS 8507 TaxID=1296122 RepID=UPI00080CFBD3|nr:uncharacterized protein I203_01341 [Kwoniella mangroviensis CBS 8507]OCF69484.1 hypothetical protein I203_01341 [Kwoniella mangroviensis CBS 8507]OCF72308.1 hypothetical protein I204_06687 [Kwoniella mangroviensis CBS 8886]